MGHPHRAIPEQRTTKSLAMPRTPLTTAIAADASA
jgi:hypothetical protein